MAIPKIDKQNIIEAIKYIDKYGVPDKIKVHSMFLSLGRGGNIHLNMLLQ